MYLCTCTQRLPRKLNNGKQQHVSSFIEQPNLVPNADRQAIEDESRYNCSRGVTLIQGGGYHSAATQMVQKHEYIQTHLLGTHLECEMRSASVFGRPTVATKFGEYDSVPN